MLLLVLPPLEPPGLLLVLMLVLLLLLPPGLLLLRMPPLTLLLELMPPLCLHWNLQGSDGEPFFLTHDDERAPAAAASGEGRKSARALRRIDSWTRFTDLDVLVCTATDRTPLLCQNSAVEFHSITPRWHRPSVEEPIAGSQL